MSSMKLIVGLSLVVLAAVVGLAIMPAILDNVDDSHLTTEAQEENLDGVTDVSQVLIKILPFLVLGAAAFCIVIVFLVRK